MRQKLSHTISYLLLFTFLITAVPAVYAADEPLKLQGYAWSENIGWISFSNLTGGGTVAYGVAIDPTSGVMSGYAWSENIGWISFNRADTGAPTASPFNGTESFIARYDFSDGRVLGWARALSNDASFDGWIKLRGDALDGSSYAVTINTSTGRASGYAWGSELIGWISFTSDNCTLSPSSACGQYEVSIAGFTPPAPPPAPPSGGGGGGMLIIIAPPQTPPTSTPQPPASSAPKPTPIPKTVLGEKVVADPYIREARTLAGGNADVIRGLRSVKRDALLERRYEKLVNDSIKGVAVQSSTKAAIQSFIVYGTPFSFRAGAGERAGIIASFRAAHGRLPQGEKDWLDTVLLSSGRFPTQRSGVREAQVSGDFEKIYKRKPVRKNVYDDRAILIMSYGIRPLKRNMNSERAATVTFIKVYRKFPATSSNWDIIRAIAYSGAKR